MKLPTFHFLLFDGGKKGHLMTSGKESVCPCKKFGFDPWVGKIPWRRKWQPTPVFLAEKPHRQRRLAL